MKKYFAGLLMLLFAGILLAENTAIKQAQDLFRQQEYKKSRQILEQVLKQYPHNPVATHYLGRVYFKTGRYKHAIRYMRRAVVLSPRQADYHFWLGRAYGEMAKYAFVFRQAALAPKVRAEFERAVVLDPAHIEARVGLVNFYLKAPAFMGGSVEKARAQIKALGKLDEVKGKLGLAMYYGKMRAYARAEAIYKQLLAAPGEHRIIVYHQYGKFLIERHRADEARVLIGKLIRLAPKRAKSHVLLGDAHAASGHYRQAALHYRRALQFNPYSRAARSRLENIADEL